MIGGVLLSEVMRKAGSPVYAYDLDAIASAARGLIEAFGEAKHLVAFAVKACSSGPVLETLIESGCGTEVVSGGELALVLALGAQPERILYSGVGKQAWEIDAAISAGEQGILAIQLESVEEVARVASRARALGRRARVSIRVNPGVEADTHAHVATGHDDAKFGVALSDLPAAFGAIDDHARDLKLVGLSSHVGSQLTDTRDYLEAARALAQVAAREEGRRGPFEMVDFGGGFGVDYGDGCPVKPADFARGVIDVARNSGLGGRQLVVEPGRSLVAPFAVLCARVIQRKVASSGRRWLIVDAGMNDLVRPAMYGARHRVEPIDAPPATAENGVLFRVVGPVCESTDDFGEHLFSTDTPDAVVFRDAGAYGMTMASEYNARPLPAEAFLRGGEVRRVFPSPGIERWVAARRGT
jgi:diaminopimelate decarboxylase